MVNFQTLPKVETPEKYFDMAVKSAKVKAQRARIAVKRADRLKQEIYVQTQHIHTMNQSIQRNLTRILKEFPQVKLLSEFYKQLCKLRFDVPVYHQSLGQVKWATQKLHHLAGMTIRRIHGSRTAAQISAARNAYYGRAGSVLESLKESLHFLEQARRALKAFPDIKEGMFTVCICGFPNVGKSTLLAKLTTAKPEIAAYAFTTKTLNTGYLKTPTKTIQLIDTPGALNREKMNKVEQEADLAVRLCANLLVYIFDPTESYPPEQQKALLAQLETLGKPILIYLSKTDILDQEVIRTFIETQGAHTIYTKSEDVKKALTDLCR